MKNILFLLIFLISFFGITNVYTQQNNNTVAEDFKDCVLNFDNFYNIYGPDRTTVMLSTCYIMYKAIGEFPHQMRDQEIAKLSNEIASLANQTDLGDIIRTFGY